MIENGRNSHHVESVGIDSKLRKSSGRKLIIANIEQGQSVNSTSAKPRPEISISGHGIFYLFSFSYGSYL